MFTVSAILLWLVVVLVVILVGVLVTPVSLRAHLRTSPRLVYRVDARVLGGLSARILVFDSSRPRKAKAKRQKTKKAPRSRGNRLYMRPNIVSALPRLVSGLFGAIHFEHLDLEMEFGLPDPADTGQLYGRLTPIQYGAGMAQGVQISLRPNFERACFAGEVDASVRFTAASFLPPIIRYIWTVFGPGR